MTTHRTRAIVDEGREIAINMNQGTFTFITAIQDETHRFCQCLPQAADEQKLCHHPDRGARRRPKTAKALMSHFKSVAAVRAADPQQLAAARV